MPIRWTQMWHRIRAPSAKDEPIRSSNITEYRIPNNTHTYRGSGITVYMIIRISIHNEKSPTGVSMETVPTDNHDNANITMEVIIETGKWKLW